MVNIEPVFGLCILNMNEHEIERKYEADALDQRCFRHLFSLLYYHSPMYCISTEHRDGDAQQYNGCTQIRSEENEAG